MALCGISAGVALALFTQTEIVMLTKGQHVTEVPAPLEIGKFLDLSPPRQNPTAQQKTKPKTVLIDSSCHSCTIRKIEWPRVVASSQKPVLFYADAVEGGKIKLNNGSDVLVVSVSEASPQIQSLLPFAPLRIYLDESQTIIGFEILTTEETL